MRTLILACILIISFQSAIGQEETTQKKDPDTNEDRRNRITFDPFHVAMGNIQFSYERITKSGKIGLRLFTSVPVVPLILGDYDKYFDTGFEGRFYPGGQKRVNYYLGLSGSAGHQDRFRYNLKLFTISETYTDYILHGLFASTLLHNGITIHPGKNKGFMMGLDFGIGTMFSQGYIEGGWCGTYDIAKDVYDIVWFPREDKNVIVPIYKFSFTLGFKY